METVFVRRFFCPVGKPGSRKGGLGTRAKVPKLQGRPGPLRCSSSVPLRVSMCSPGITRRPQVHCGCSMEERFVFKLYDPSLNSAKKGRGAMTTDKNQETYRGCDPYSKGSIKQSELGRETHEANNIRQLTSVQLEG